MPQKNKRRPAKQPAAMRNAMTGGIPRASRRPFSAKLTNPTESVISPTGYRL